MDQVDNGHFFIVMGIAFHWVNADTSYAQMGAFHAVVEEGSVMGRRCG